MYLCMYSEIETERSVEIFTHIHIEKCMYVSICSFEIDTEIQQIREI